jgi:hypothetical protein
MIKKRLTDEELGKIARCPEYLVSCTGQKFHVKEWKIDFNIAGFVSVSPVLFPEKKLADIGRSET